MGQKHAVASLDTLSLLPSNKNFYFYRFCYIYKCERPQIFVLMKIIKSYQVLPVVAFCFSIASVLPANVCAQSSIANDREGFTLLLSFGPGMQKDVGLHTSALGLGSVRLGVGDFLKNDLAVFLRLSATRVHHNRFFERTQTAGLLGASLQYWPMDKLYVEAGPGIGFLDRDFSSGYHLGVGVLVGTGVTVYNRGNHNIQLGVEYAPAVLVGDTIHNLGVTIGYQLF